MKIKRFLAPDMRTALQHVRQEHGPDAVILSNRVTPDGVEIVAASQYDEELVRNAADTTSPAPALTAALSTPEGAAADTAIAAASVNDEGARASASTDAQPAVRDQEKASPSPELTAFLAQATTTGAEPERAAVDFPPTLPPASSKSTPPSVTAAGAVDENTNSRPATPIQRATTMTDTTPNPALSDDTSISTQLREEFARMRQMLERGLNRMTDERLRCSPARKQLMEWLEGQGFTDEIVREVALGVPADCAPHKIQAQAVDLLSERLPIYPSNLLDDGGVMALIGPSGAGKTSTVGKLAAHYSARYGVREIALISLDHARPGGSDRLYCLARQLGIAAHEADSGQALVSLLQRLQDYRVILIDCPGVTPRHPQSAEQLNWLRSAEVRSLLVLPANTHHVDLDDIVRRFQPAEPQGVVVTRLDETRRPGGVFSVVTRHQLPLTWVSDGQHLHDDLHRAEAASLLQRLSEMDCEVPSPYDPVAALVAKHAFA